MPTLRGILPCRPSRPNEAKRGSAMTTPNFEEFQKFSKQQLDAVNAATATMAKGLQEIAAEIFGLFEEGFRRHVGRRREAARRQVGRNRDPDPDRIRQVRLRGFRRPGEQDQRDLREARDRSFQAGRDRFRQGSGQVRFRRATARESRASADRIVSAKSFRAFRGRLSSRPFFVARLLRSDDKASCAAPTNW